jgi:hypothetical protein
MRPKRDNFLYSLLTADFVAIWRALPAFRDIIQGIIKPPPGRTSPTGTDERSAKVPYVLLEFFPALLHAMNVSMAKDGVSTLGESDNHIAVHNDPDFIAGAHDTQLHITFHLLFKNQEYTLRVYLQEDGTAVNIHCEHFDKTTPKDFTQINHLKKLFQDYFLSRDKSKEVFRDIIKGVQALLRYADEYARTAQRFSPPPAAPAAAAAAPAAAGRSPAAAGELTVSQIKEEYEDCYKAILKLGADADLESRREIIALYIPEQPYHEQCISILSAVTDHADLLVALETAIKEFLKEIFAGDRAGCEGAIKQQEEMFKIWKTPRHSSSPGKR